MSRMLPGRPLCPYGTFSGSTSTVLPLGRNVTLYFFVAGLYLTSSMYGLVPPMEFLPPVLQGLSHNKARFLAPLGRTVKASAQLEGAWHLCAACRTLQRNLRLRRVSALRAPSRPRCSSTAPQGARLRDSNRQCACGLVCSRCPSRTLSAPQRLRQCSHVLLRSSSPIADSRALWRSPSGSIPLPCAPRSTGVPRN